MNEYFNAPDSPVDFTAARAAQVRAIFAAIAAGFDLLPPRDALLQGRVNYAAAGGTANAITAELEVAPEAYVAGATVRLKIANTNNGPATLNVNGLGPISIRSSSGAALAGGELVADAIQDFTYDGTYFRLPATGPQGPQGPMGPPDGVALRSGAGAPPNGLGNDNDFYIDTSAWKVHGPKAGGAWPAGTSIIGPAGAAGVNGVNGTNAPNVLSGAGAPGGGTGNNGDYYFKTSDPVTFYGPKAGGVWPGGVSLKGNAGANGANGSDAVVNLAANYAWTGLHQFNGIEAGFRDLPIFDTQAGAFTVGGGARGGVIVFTGDGAGDGCYVPLHAQEAIPVGAVITVVNDGTGALPIYRNTDGTTTVVLKLVGTGVDANRSLAVGGIAWLWKRANNTWFIGGTGVS